MDVQKLKHKMAEKGLNVEILATIIGVDRSTMYRKLNEGGKITVSDALKIKSALELTCDEATDIFFG